MLLSQSSWGTGSRLGLLPGGTREPIRTVGLLPRGYEAGDIVLHQEDGLVLYTDDVVFSGFTY